MFGPCFVIQCFGVHFDLRRLFALLNVCRIAVVVLCLFLAVPWVGLWSVALSGHTQLLFNMKKVVCVRRQQLL